jgi:ribonuclease T2
MSPCRSSRSALFILALAFGGAPPVQAQGLWNEIFGAPAAKPAPCVLDECLNGGAGSPAQPAAAEPQSAPAPPVAQAGPPAVAPGAFDFYLLALSWSPGFCDTGGAAKAPDQCAAGAAVGFVVHGLWPQNAHGYPSDCDDNPRPVSRAALALTQGVYPDEGLARYEWRKHGTCTGLNPEAYFASVRRARDSIAIPESLSAPRREQDVAPIEIARAFIAANPGLRLETMAVTCARGELEDVRICLSKDLRAFVACPEVAHRTCRSPSIAIAPVR